MIFSSIHCSLHSTCIWPRVCHSIFEEDAVSTERKIQRNNMLGNHCGDAHWNLDSNSYLPGTRYMFCFIVMVCVKIRNVWAYFTVYPRWSPHRQCISHLDKIIQDDVGRAEPKDRSISHGILPSCRRCVVGKCITRMDILHC